MDILRPQLQHIDGISYRINPGNICPDFDQGAPQPYYEFDSDCHGMIEQENEENYEVEKDQNGRYKTSFHVPKSFFSYVIGTKGATRRRLEGETRTTIIVPKVGCDGDIVVTGCDKKSVCSARNRVNMLVMSARKKQRLTHCLSLPLLHDIFVERFNQFKREVLEICPNLDDALFQKPKHLHMTLGVLKLCDSVERQQASAALDYCHKNIISQMLGGKRELRIRMQGLDYMNDDPSAVNVLYAKAVSLGDSSLLQKLVVEVSNYFIQEGLIENAKTDGECLIHITLMNSKFVKNDKSPDQESPSKKKTFDASTILEVYNDYNFGEASISRLDLSALRTNAEDGYWQATATIDLFKF